MLTVSRPDINVDAITEIDPQLRFIKLPITNYLKLLDVYDTINRPQVALINAVNDPKYRFICAALENSLSPVKPLIDPTSFLKSSKNFTDTSALFSFFRDNKEVERGKANSGAEAVQVLVSFVSLVFQYNLLI